MRKYFSLILLICSISAYTQNRFTVELSGSNAFIPDISFSESYKTRPGIAVNIGIERQILKQFDFNAGIGFSLQGFKKEININFGEAENDYSIIYGDILENDDVTNWAWQRDATDIFVPIKYPLLTKYPTQNVRKTSILYLAIPVKVQYSFIPNRLKAGIGFTSYLVAFSGQIRDYYHFQTESIEEYNDTSGNGLNNYQLNGVISMEYRIFKSIWIQAGYNHGFLSIYDKQPETANPSSINKYAKYRTVEVGLKYGF